MPQSIALKTQAQVAMKRAAKIAAAERAAVRSAEWGKRLDPAAWTCRREGDAWIADCAPAGKRLEFYRGVIAGDVVVKSHSGAIYQILAENGVQVCTCPAHAKAGTCYHLIAPKAVCTAARMERQLAAPTTAPTETPEERRERIRREASEVYA
jgi:hypothetical protein